MASRRGPVFLVLASLLATAAVTAVTPLRAQEQQPCSYDQCALRMQYRFFGGVRVVQGREATPVSRPGFMALRIAPFAAAGDTVRYHYSAYRTHGRRAGAFGIVAGITMGVAYLLEEQKPYDYDGEKIALLSVGVVTGIIAAVNGSRQQDHLQRAIWHYNRELPR